MRNALGMQYNFCIFIPKLYETIEMQRDIRLDLVRSFAIVAVLICHSFGFNELIAPQDFVRLIGLTGVPLFLILTGYLNHEKTLDDYYEKGKWTACIRVLLAYVFLGSICFAVDRICYPEHPLSIKAWGLALLQFELTPYAWYIEMWIGLFFLTPILNIIVRDVKEKHENWLILTLMGLSSLPAFLNRHGVNIVPNFWVNLYPVTLYFVGVWLARHTIKARTFILAMIALAVLLSEPIANVLLGGRYTHYLGSQNNLVFCVLAIIFFTILCRVNINSKFMRRAVTLISKASLYMFLVSCAFDTIFRCYFMPVVSENSMEFFPWYVLMLVFSFTLSFFVAWLYMVVETAVLHYLKHK